MKSLDASSVIQSEFTVTAYFPTDQLLLFVFEPLYSVHVLGEGLLDGDNIKMWPLSLWHQSPVNMKRSSSVGWLLAHRLRRWPNIKLSLGQHLVFSGVCVIGASTKAGPDRDQRSGQQTPPGSILADPVTKKSRPKSEATGMWIWQGGRHTVPLHIGLWGRYRLLCTNCRYM